MLREGHGGIVRASEDRNARIEQQLRDYAEVGRQLFWQRQLIFGVALLLAAFYYSPLLSFVNLVIVALVEFYDNQLFRRIATSGQMTSAETRVYSVGVMAGTIVSALTICFYAVWIAELQGESSHFMPLFFLFAAGVFAAMNNHQIPRVLAVRLTIYGVTFFLIPVRDILASGDTIRSESWVQLFASLFVAYFIVDCSLVFLRMYRERLDRMEQLERRNVQLSQALEAKSRFLSTMSHELRTPLTSIRASLDLVQSGKMGELPEITSSTLKIAQSNCQTLMTLIDEILDIQKVESGQISLERTRIDLTRIIAETVEQNRPYATNFGCDITLDLPEGPVWIRGDEGRIKQAVGNLLSNAAKFSPSGSVARVTLSEAGDIARIAVADEGIGISDSFRSQVFQPFAQADASDTRKTGGTGLGLSISKEIVVGHGGRIGFENNSDGGTTFTIELPIADR